MNNIKFRFVSVKLLFFLFLFFLTFQVIEYLVFKNKVIPGSFVVVIPVFGALSLFVLHFFGSVSYLPKKGAAFFAAMVLLPLVSILFQYLFDWSVTAHDGRNSLNFIINTYIVGASWLVVGYFLGMGRYNFSRRVPYFCFIIWVMAIFWNSQGGVVDLSSLRSESEFKELSHLWFSEPGVLLALACYAASTSLRDKGFVLSLTVVTLFVAGGRSSFYLFMFSVFVYELASADRKENLVNFFKLVIVLVGAGVLVGFWFFVGDDSHLSRFMVIGDLSQDASWQARVYAFEVAVESVFSSLGALVFGSTHLYTEKLGSVGLYAHNFLSGIQFYGLPFFLLAIMGLIGSVSYIRSFFCQQRVFSIDKFKVLLFIYMFSSLLVTKSFATNFVWLSFGMLFSSESFRGGGKVQKIGFQYWVRN